MADFSLITEHPWISGGTILVGGLVVFVLWRGRGSSSANAAPSGGYPYAATADPAQTQANAAQGIANTQANVQISTLSAQLQALMIQSQTAIGGKQIDAGVTMYTVDAARDVQLAQIGAEYGVAMGTQYALLEQAKLDAGVQNNYINKLVYGGPAGTAPVTAVAPIPARVPSNTVYNPPTPAGINGGTMVTAAPLPGGTPVVPLPNYASCDPRDSACVAQNQTLNIAYVNNVLDAQATNNRSQCLLNAQNGRTPAEVAALSSACNGAY